MFQQHRCITAASMLLVSCLGCRLIAGPASAPPSVPAKFSSTASAPPTFFNTPELDPSLAADTRLDRKVTLEEIGISLGELLLKVSIPGTPLSCAADCGETKLQVRLKDRSLRSVMAALAQLTPGTWKREGKGYCLYTDSKATEYEDHWWQLYGVERERVLAALRTQILTQMQRKPYHPNPDDPNPENMSGEIFDQIAQGQEFWYLLPEPLQRQIAGQIVDTAYYRSGQIFVRRPIEGAVVVPFQSIPAQAQADALASASLLLNGNKMGNPAVLSFNNIGFVVAPRIMTTDGRWRDMPATLRVRSQAITSTLSLNQDELPELMKQMGAQAPETWKPLVAYQEQHVWVNDPPLTKPNPQQHPRRPEILNWLADKADVEFVADYYSVPGEALSDAAKKQKLTRPLKQELDFQADQEDMSWKQRTDGLYLFRDNRWYRDDRLEVPDKTLKGLLKTLQAAETPTQATPTAEPAVPDNSLAAQLGVADDIVTQLTPWQIANGLPNYTLEPSRDLAKVSSAPVKLHKQTMIMNGKTRTFFSSMSTSTARPFDHIADIILDDYHTYLFHSGLTSDRADAMLSGSLPVSALSSTQAQQAAYLLPDLQVRFENQPQTLIGLRPEPGFGQAQLSPSGSPAASLPLQRLRLAVSAPNNTPNGDSASP